MRDDKRIKAYEKRREKRKRLIQTGQRRKAGLKRKGKQRQRLIAVEAFPTLEERITRERYMREMKDEQNRATEEGTGGQD